jgi:fructose-specific phosphotransferase system IIA component
VNIVDLFDPNCMTMGLSATEKWGAIAELAALLHAAGRLSSLPDYLNAVREREAQVSTGVGMGVGIPHGKSSAVVSPSIAFGRSSSGVDFAAIDGEPVHLVFLLAVPESYGNREYMRALADLARLLVHETFRDGLLAATSVEEVMAVLQHARLQKGEEAGQED